MKNKKVMKDKFNGLFDNYMKLCDKIFNYLWDKRLYTLYIIFVLCSIPISLCVILIFGITEHILGINEPHDWDKTFGVKWNG